MVRGETHGRGGRWRLAAANGAGLALGAALDGLLGDPVRGHPVALFGAAARWLERHWYRPTRRAGVRHVVVCLAVPVTAAAAASMATRHRPLLRAATTALVTWTVLGATSLRREGLAAGVALSAGDLAAARARLPRLCGRDPDELDVDGLSRAAVESVAENTSDAVVAPLCWGAVAGLPGLVGYRVVNTLDAMIGHRWPHYTRFGWAAARLDDLANLAPSRLTAALTVAAAGVVGGGRVATVGVWLRDGLRHPSPNAGQCEAATAGALGVRLGGRLGYRGRQEFRPHLGDGRPAAPADVIRAVRLSVAVGALAVVLTVGHAAATPARRALLRRVAARLAGGRPSTGWRPSRAGGRR